MEFRGLNKVTNMMTGYQTTIPKGARLGTKKIAGNYARTYLEQMKIARITKWTGRSFNLLRRQITNPVQLDKNSYGVVAPSTLVMLDQMKTHWVSLKRGRSITRWAKTKLGKETGGIKVHRHPWITDANRKARRLVKRIAEKEINKKIRRKGKR